MGLVLGAIADDFTGATDLANNLVRSGMRTVQVIGVPERDVDLHDVDAVVVALKSRTCSPETAVADSLKALTWLQHQGVRQLFFKYCSTFDSTDDGNIGPVADALVDSLNVAQTVMVPAFPLNGRTVYQGHLFVFDLLLNESGMQDHPLTPMKDANLVRVLSRQTPHRVGLLSHEILAQGYEVVVRQLAALTENDVRHVLCDTVDDTDLRVIAEAVVDYPLVTGGSGLAEALPTQYRDRGWLKSVSHAGELESATGACLVLSGSCSQATLRQIKHFLAHHEGFALDPCALAEGEAHFEQALAFARERLFNEGGGAVVLIYSTTTADEIKAVQATLGVALAGEMVERALSRLAQTLVSEGVGRLVVAGGETSGAVVSALGITELRIGKQIDPGVPWTQAPSPRQGEVLSLALKSGNFGGVDFFSRAFEELA